MEPSSNYAADVNRPPLPNVGSVQPVAQPDMKPPQARQKIASATAIFQYHVLHSSDCTFDKDDLIEVFEIVCHDWWHGLNVRTGREGVFPAGRVKIIQGTAVAAGVIARVRALYNFEAANETELSLLAGQEILVTELTSNDWWKGKTGLSSDREGIFPRNYIFIHDKTPPPKPTLEEREKSQRVYQAYGNTDYNGALHVGLSFEENEELIVVTELSDSVSWGYTANQNAQGAFPHSCVIFQFQAKNPGAAVPGKPILKARALFDFDGNFSADLSFNKGDLIDVTKTLDYDILWGRNTNSGYEGLFPGAFITPVKASEKILPNPIIEPNRAPTYATILYTWAGASDGDLKINKDDQVLLIEDVGLGWWSGTNTRTNQTGIFPQNYALFPETIESRKPSLSVDVLNTSRPGPAPAAFENPSEFQKAQRFANHPAPGQTYQPAGQSETVTILPPTPTKEAASEPIRSPLQSQNKNKIPPPTKLTPANKLKSDLVRDSKLNTSFIEKDAVVHTSYTFHPGNRHNRIVLEEKWRVKSPLGQGAFGQVFLQECVEGNKQGTLRAVKKILKSSPEEGEQKINYDRELEAIAKFSHEKYVHCFARSFGWYENESSIFITMEYFQYGDLQKHMRGRFPEYEVGHIICQLLEGLSFMHDNGFAHRDLKPANILVKELSPNWWVKISDFGISKRAEGGKTAFHTVVGSPRYLAPEVMGIFSPQDVDNIDTQTMAYTVAVDQWALGAIAFRLLTSRDPFPEPRSLYNYINGKEDFPVVLLEASRVSIPCIDFVRGVLHPIPSRRPEADLALTHPWLEDINMSFPLLEQGETLASQFSMIQFDATEASGSWTSAMQGP